MIVHTKLRFRIRIRLSILKVRKNNEEREKVSKDVRNMLYVYKFTIIKSLPLHHTLHSYATQYYKILTNAHHQLRGKRV